MKRHLIIGLKIAVPLAIVVWLLTTIERSQLESLRGQLFQNGSASTTWRNWGMLCGAFGVSLAAVSLTFIRWYFLVRTLGIPFRLRDAFRLGFLGHLFNFVSLGSVGGDLFKAVFIAREQPRRRAEAVATVIVDRIIGLYALLLVTSAVILFADLSEPSAALKAICNVTLLATGIGGICVMAVLVPGFTRGSLSEFLTGLPRIGTTIGKLIQSVRMYRDKYSVVLAIFVMSMIVHTMFAFAMFLIAGALFPQTPTLAEHLIIIPLSMVAGALPFTPAGLGSFEIALETLYRIVPDAARGGVAGVLVALVYRLITILIAAIGVVYYWTCRREVSEIFQEASETSDLDVARPTLKN